MDLLLCHVNSEKEKLLEKANFLLHTVFIYIHVVSIYC
jgi:hypothetical protein